MPPLPRPAILAPRSPSSHGAQTLNRSGRVVAWGLVVLLASVLGGVVAVLLAQRAESGRGMPAFSVYSEEIDGLAPLARWLRQIGFTPLALVRPVQQQWKADDPPAVLVMVEPLGTEGPSLFAADLPEADVRAIVRWVEGGNTLLLVGRHAHALHRALKVDLSTDLRPEIVNVPHEAETVELGAYTRYVDHVVVEGTDTVQAADGLPLWLVNNQPGALVLARGKGRVILLPDPSLLTNRGLDRKNRPYNGDLLYNVLARHARDGRVYFDEFHHGFHSGGGFWGYLAFHDLRWLLLPLLTTALMAAWAGAVRLGPAVPLVQSRQADAVDYASALARIYQRAGVRGLLARGAARDFLAKAGRAVGLRQAAIPAEVLAAWQRRNPDSPETARLREVVGGIAALRQGQVSERTLFSWVRGADQFLLDTAVAPRGKQS